MARTDFKSVNEYIASKPNDVRITLNRVRSTIRKAVPAADEVISYQIPTYKLNGVPVLYFAGWKQHYSLYPASDALLPHSRTSSPAMTLAKAPSAFRSVSPSRSI